MTFGVSSCVTLLFDFWNVDGPAGMVLSVLVVLLLNIFHELLKVWRVWLTTRSKLSKSRSLYAVRLSYHSDCGSVLNSTPSETSLTPMESYSSTPNTRNSWLLHGIQTALHVLQVTLGYLLMLCVMSFNTWIFIGVITGSALGYFISFPLLGQK
ncbi:probable low affinity copper uptake protein 2 isoform X2 [Betta splendens]|nr:probable low affinity copper uptake protein 2 isoform X2 [Betta splendens]XP_055369114.1 probable low affinity copper uptake protein 2 isoform X2 [Betta splendens]XP_055369115.1 probable low affinity copper uptake protein 2 isoform X2 [Betta splendens]